MCFGKVLALLLLSSSKKVHPTLVNAYASQTVMKQSQETY